MCSDIAIRVRNVSKVYQIYDKPQDRLKQTLWRGRKQFYREFKALDDVSFEVKKGETVGIIGRNGSGKSTLLQIICGTVSRTEGDVATYGRVAALLELGAGFNTEFTGRENVLLNAEILGFSREEMKDRMADVLAFSELGSFLDQPVKTYSSGMYSRLAFSTAIHVDPEILIIDEALAVGDSRFVAKCMRRIKEIQALGATILFVSHDVNSVRTLCQRAIWVDKGNIIEDGDVFPVTGKYMEFMFKDDGDENQVLRDDVDTTEDVKNESSHQQTTNQAELSSTSEKDITPELDDRPVTHWGSRKGVILGASVCDEQGVRKDIFTWGEPIEVAINVNVPMDISREHLSIAFSIKDLRGTDLIVSTTHDFDTAMLPSEECFSVRFRFVNYLVTGKFLLVSAVENRQHKDIHYYEYLEGAHYFSSIVEKHFFGIFQPKIQQIVKVY